MFLELGDGIVKRNTIDIDALRAEAAREATEAAERRHVRELRAALSRQQRQLEDEKARALDKQKQVCIVNS